MAQLACALAALCPVAAVRAQPPPQSASAVRVAPGVIRPGATGDEAGLTRRPTGIDVEFVDRAGMAGKTELLASQLALERSANRDVKAFAHRMVDDHGGIAGALRELGARKGVPVQTKSLVDPALEALRRKEGHAFDVAYVDLVGPAAHEQAIREYETEAESGRDPQLRAFAARTLPILKEHLAAARRLSALVAAAH
ncbi:DUF4142 domain-containing protein [Burkholderia sp. Bp8963]|uniref:DUF4142 domain-containing protein n=1 Tax=Burkholderia sp. Bp8963 TaxID=2184547 RepID=UPI0021AB64B5|nr:DUF4142 domain-containing protein [Burkholderia sp. Bp8963]